MSVTGIPWRRPMTGRDRDEEHRASTPLELLFDLCFVVAVAGAASSLHHGLTDGHFGHALVGYLTVFFAIWWAWMNFTWFASAYDTDDVAYRLLTFVQMTGALVLAAGVPRAFDRQDFAVVTVGYVIMRLAMLVQWLRVRREHRARRSDRRDLRRGHRRRAGALGGPAVRARRARPCSRSSSSPCWTRRCPSSPSAAVAPRRGTRGTSPSATACSPSSCWVR